MRMCNCIANFRPYTSRLHNFCRLCARMRSYFYPCPRIGAAEGGRDLVVRYRVAPLLAGALFLISMMACNQGQVAPPSGARFEVTVADTVPDNADIYIAGTFNDWEPGESEYRLSEQDDGTYEITLPDLPSGPVQFKFTLGSWEYVEVDEAGDDLGNREVTVPEDGGVTYASTIVGWRNPDRPWPFPNSTATGSVSVLDRAMRMTPLDRERRVWIYLPPGYDDSEGTYPVLYMHDGQNLFDAATSYAGEWGIDETLDSLHAAGDPGIIVVGIDNGGDRRMDEYSPWVNDSLDAGGEGDAYVRFLVETLKPRIDSTYRTKPGRRHTGIMGSSMGGLISTYAMFEYPNVFGKAGIFSPAYWFAPEVYDEIPRDRPVASDTRIYMMSGALETVGDDPDSVYVKDHRRMVEELEEVGFERGVHLVSHIRADGKHAEWFWRREFAAAYQWLFDRRGSDQT